MFRLVKKEALGILRFPPKTSVKTDSQQSFDGALALFVSYFLGTWVLGGPDDHVGGGGAHDPAAGRPV